jgi:Arc/MetJ-type ribon-helix-helix transcriptional regulator
LIGMTFELPPELQQLAERAVAEGLAPTAAAAVQAGLELLLLTAGEAEVDFDPTVAAAIGEGIAANEQGRHAPLDVWGTLDRSRRGIIANETPTSEPRR